MTDKEKFLREVNRAYEKGDEQFFMEHITDDICWEIVGEKEISGKTEFKEVLDRMKEMPPVEIQVENVIFDDRQGVVRGVVVSRNRLGQKKHFGFCDIYKFAEGEKLRLSGITSYVIDISRHVQYK
ncbi:nuclear transport factor 2 family protein [Salinimicrobium tongyeongense]|jgi:ketosteroid isomerase-like protein|uniref:Nuclear transport factor 2 family protein n=1 Tax=Salinimicrobium tongyeongense TaxID=2809707 RepID=A0ABY6NQH5_9FLAO|nr:nuclear transport factor 2 family protein [Salinimicrobium tongyeongense]UZH55165.1 nuclear transport factor 2 family protein [Salinimicrobium tongyeongense]